MLSVARRSAWKPTVAVLALSLWAAGCTTPVPLEAKKDVPVESRTGTNAASQNAATGQAAPQSRVASVNVEKAPTTTADPLARTVYFDFDSFSIKDEFRGVVDANAKRLATNRAQRVTIEGHTDERGGREYNLALGQKRAEALAKALALLGASESQIEAVSFGEERPAAQGSDEAVWAKNRRAEVKDR